MKSILLYAYNRKEVVKGQGRPYAEFAHDELLVEAKVKPIDGFLNTIYFVLVRLLKRTERREKRKMSHSFYVTDKNVHRTAHY